jgi:hypothetical protein
VGEEGGRGWGGVEMKGKDMTGSRNEQKRGREHNSSATDGMGEGPDVELARREVEVGAYAGWDGMRENGGEEKWN